MGSVSRPPVPSTHIDWQEPQVHQPSGRRTCFANLERNWADAADVLFGGVWVDYLQGGEYWDGLGVSVGYDAVWDIKGKLSFFTLPETWPTNLFIMIMLVMEWLHRGMGHGFEFLSGIKSMIIRCVVVILIIEVILIFKAPVPSQFIYFQF